MIMRRRRRIFRGRKSSRRARGFRKQRGGFRF